MSDNYVCPKCNSEKFIGYDDGSGAECGNCGHFIPDNKLDDYAYVKIKKYELARRDEELEKQKEIHKVLFDAMGLLKVASDLVSADNRMLSERVERLVQASMKKDEIIRKLKEDAERLAKTFIAKDSGYGDKYCVHCDLIFFTDLDKHKDDCPITLHHALMKELE